MNRSRVARRSVRVGSRAANQSGPRRVESEFGDPINIIVTQILQPTPNIIRVEVNVDVQSSGPLSANRRWLDFVPVFNRFMTNMRQSYGGGSHTTLMLRDPNVEGNFYRNQSSLSLRDIDSDFILNLISQYQSNTEPSATTINDLKITFNIVKT